MIVAGRGELNHVPSAGHVHAPGSFAQCADAAVLPALRRQIMSQSLDLRRPYCEAQLIVVATGQCQLAGALISHRAHQLFGDRQVVKFELHATTTGMGELSRIAEQSIRHIDTRRRIASQTVPKGQAWRRIEESLPEIAFGFGGSLESGLLDSESRRRITRCAGNEHFVTGAAARPEQSSRLGDVTEDLDGDALAHRSGVQGR